jgi:hypothetical protein
VVPGSPGIPGSRDASRGQQESEMIEQGRIYRILLARVTISGCVYGVKKFKFNFYQPEGLNG